MSAPAVHNGSAAAAGVERDLLAEGEVARPLRAIALLASLPFLAMTILALCMALDVDPRRLPMMGLALVTAVMPWSPPYSAGRIRRSRNPLSTAASISIAESAGGWVAERSPR